MANKVKFNLKNVHYAKLTVADDGVPSWEKPTAIPGAVSLSLSAEGESTKFYADGTAYYVGTANNGYSGNLELALVPEDFAIKILKETKDANGVLTERNDVETEKFALLFQFDGDVHGTRHVLYNCTASRSQVESSTTEDSKEPQTETLSLEATPLEDGLVNRYGVNN